MEKIALEGFWLLVALFVSFGAGVVLSQKVKDKLSGVPSTLRAALSAAQKAALADIKKAETAVVNDVLAKLGKAPAPAPAAAPAPAPAAPASPTA